MLRTDSTTGKTPAVLQLVSGSSEKPSTFVLREVQQLCRMGFAVEIAQLRPFFGRMSTSGFDELGPNVRQPGWWSPTILVAAIYYACTKPTLLWSYIKMILTSGSSWFDLAKLSYLWLVALKIAFEHRANSRLHLRAHFLHSEAMAAYFVGGLLNIPYSITVHTVLTHFPSGLIREVTKNASFLVADTLEVSEFLKSLSIPQERIRLIRNGLPLNELKCRLDRSKNGKAILLAAGYLVPKKGFDVLLAACRILAERGVQFRCVIAGDGAERKALESLVEEFRLLENVVFLGNVSFDVLQEWYYQATIFVMPSVTLPDGSTDGLPTVVLEALACGTPVIGTSVAGIPEIIVHGRTGFLVPPNVPDAMADQIQILLEQRSLRLQMAREGRRCIEEDFDIGRNSQKLANLILAKSSSSQGPISTS